MDTMISKNIIRRAGVLIPAAVVVPFVALAASGCGGATTAGGTTNGLEHQAPTVILQDAAHAVAAAKSVQIVWTPPSGKRAPSQVVAQIQGGSETLTVVDSGIAKARFTIIGQYAYAKINSAVLKMLGGLPLAKSPFGRWLKIPAARLHLPLEHLSLASIAAILTRHGALQPAVRQATLHGKKVVVVTDQRTGGKIYIANTGPAYPLRLQFRGSHPQRLDFSDYGANFHIVAPRNTIPAR